MADTKISALTAVTVPAATDEYAVNQGGTSKKMSAELQAMFTNAPIFCVQAADRAAFANNTTAQAIFTTSANGAVTITAGLYWFELLMQMTGMSATSGNGVFSLGGTATLANPRMMHSVGLDNTTQATGAAIGGAFVQGGTAFTTNSTTAGTGTAMGLSVRGLFACSAGGTLIPQFALTTATAAAIVKAGTFFRLLRIGEASDTTRGTWS